MKRNLTYLLFATLGCMLLTSCDLYRSVTPNRIVKNQQAISDLTKYMYANKLDTLSRKYCSRDINHKLRKMRIHRIEKKPTTLFISFPENGAPLKETDTIVKFKNYGNFLHYQQTIYVIPSKLKDKYNSEKFNDISFKQVNDTIYLETVPFIAFM